MVSEEQLQEWARQAAFSTMGEVREVLDRVVAMTAEACAVVCDDNAKHLHKNGLNERAIAARFCGSEIREGLAMLAAIHEKAREKK